MHGTFKQAHWRSLSQADLIERLEAGGDLYRLVNWYRGDPRLTAWEEGFLASIATMLARYRCKVAPSAKQWHQLHRIFDKLEQEADDTEDGCDG